MTFSSLKLKTPLQLQVTQLTTEQSQAAARLHEGAFFLLARPTCVFLSPCIVPGNSLDVEPRRYAGSCAKSRLLSLVSACWMTACVRHMMEVGVLEEIIPWGSTWHAREDTRLLGTSLCMLLDASSRRWPICDHTCRQCFKRSNER